MRITKGLQVKEKIESIEVGGSFNKKEFIIKVWGKSDYFIDRSFDVLFSTAKKELSERGFATHKGLIIRLK